MYDKAYAEVWIKNNESGKDVLRVNHLEPFLGEWMERTPEKSVILDVGCGTGFIAGLLKPGQEYHGIDITKELLDYVKSRFRGRNIHLKHGFLPGGIDAQDGFSDFTICCMVLHCVSNLEESIDALFSKTRPGGRILIVEFSDAAEIRLRGEFYKTISESGEKHIRGTTTLPSGIKLTNEIFFHKEKHIEGCIMKHGTYTKTYVGPLFVAFDAVKMRQPNQPISARAGSPA